MPVSEVVKILRGARIGRASTEEVFSFVHRRFAEYFLIDTFREQPTALPLEDFPTNSRWRDALVLYAEVAEEPVAKEMADRCWEEIRKANEMQAEVAGEPYMRALHSLRFLASAFRGRREVLEHFEPELASLIQKAVREQDMLVAKHAIEAAGGVVGSEWRTHDHRGAGGGQSVAVRECAARLPLSALAADADEVPDHGSSSRYTADQAPENVPRDDDFIGNWQWSRAAQALLSASASRYSILF